MFGVCGLGGRSGCDPALERRASRARLCECAAFRGSPCLAAALGVVSCRFRGGTCFALRGLLRHLGRLPQQAVGACGEGWLLSIRVCAARREELWRARLGMCCSSIPESPAGCPGERGQLAALLPTVGRIRPAGVSSGPPHPGAAQPFAPGSVCVRGVSWPSSALIGSAGVGGTLFQMYPKCY